MSANNLVEALRAQGELSEATRIFRETLEVRLHVLGAEHSETCQELRGAKFRLYYNGGLIVIGAMSSRRWCRR